MAAHSLDEERRELWDIINPERLDRKRFIEQLTDCSAVVNVPFSFNQKKTTELHSLVHEQPLRRAVSVKSFRHLSLHFLFFIAINLSGMHFSHCQTTLQLECPLSSVTMSLAHRLRFSNLFRLLLTFQRGDAAGSGAELRKPLLGS